MLLLLQILHGPCDDLISDNSISSSSSSSSSGDDTSPQLFSRLAAHSAAGETTLQLLLSQLGGRYVFCAHLAGVFGEVQALFRDTVARMATFRDTYITMTTTNTCSSSSSSSSDNSSSSSSGNSGVRTTLVDAEAMLTAAAGRGRGRGSASCRVISAGLKLTDTSVRI